jgi:transposase InsO family protein
MKDNDQGTPAQRWARLRFAIVAPLLVSPPKRGTLHREFEALAKRSWTHPTSGAPAHFAVSTIERWYYKAKNASRDPLGALRKTQRKDAGTHGLGDRLRQALRTQHKDYPEWSYQLHYDNLLALAGHDDNSLGNVPSYTTVRRFMKACGLLKSRPRSRRQTPGTERAARRLEKLEVRSFEASHVHSLWHLDFHAGSRRVLTPAGQWLTPHLFGTLDDRSRLCCHLQWYLDETAETLVHGLSQAFQKRALPRALMTDNGSAMIAAETVQGLEDLGILHETTLAESPYQNGKQESFWAQVEGRLLAMLKGVEELTLELLNEATQAWVELEYNKKFHQELGAAPGVPARAATHCATRFASYSGAPSAAPMARSASRHSASRCRRDSATTRACWYVTRAGTSLTSTSSTHEATTSSPLSTPSTNSATPMDAAGACNRYPRSPRPAPCPPVRSHRYSKS